MNRSISLHPVSLVLGLALEGICLLSMSHAIVATSPLRIEYTPHPRDYIQLREGLPYTVPTGKLFVLTGLGTMAGPQGLVTRLRLNGSSIEALTVGPEYATSPSATGCSVVPIPVGLAAPAGSVLEVIDGSAAPDDARAWGYLAPAVIRGAVCAKSHRELHATRSGLTHSWLLREDPSATSLGAAGPSNWPRFLSVQALRRPACPQGTEDRQTSAIGLCGWYPARPQASSLGR